MSDDADDELARLAAVSRCIRCCLQLRVCICDRLPTIATRTRVVILRHAAERAKASNSARLVAQALARCELRDWGARAPTPVADLAAPGTALLFPGGGRPWRGEPLDTLVVLDGTWTQARRMWRKIPALRDLPHIALPEAPPRPRLRQAPEPDRVSTLEAIAAALAQIEPGGAALTAPLLDFFDDYTERARRTGRGD